MAAREWDYMHHAIVTSVRSAKPHQLTAWQRFTDNGPLAFLPLERDGQAGLVFDRLVDHAERSRTPDGAG